MSATAPYKNIIASRGPAVGRIRRINHLQIVVIDMEASLRFYRDLLGFKVIRTIGDDFVPPGNPNPAWRVPRDYFVELPDGSCLSLIEVEGAQPPQQSIWVPSFWPGQTQPASRPEKVDHLAFDVDSREDLVWFQQHLRANGVAVSEILKRDVAPRFVDSIYFNDPSGVPLEIATWDRNNPVWKQQTPEDWLDDKNPVPSLIA